MSNQRRTRESTCHRDDKSVSAPPFPSFFEQQFWTDVAVHENVEKLPGHLEMPCELPACPDGPGKGRCDRESAEAEKGCSGTHNVAAERRHDSALLGVYI